MRPKVEVVPFRHQDLSPILSDPSKTTAKEHPSHDYTALRALIARSDNMILGMVEGEPVLLIGVERTSMVTNSGIFWMISSAALERHAVLFIRYAKRYVKLLYGIYEELFCLCPRDSVVDGRWIGMLGFEQYGVFGDQLQYRLKR
jgi:hypothetical protein